MIQVQIKGGLGNQMFQYTYGRNLELSDKKVLFDISFFNVTSSLNDTARDYKLNKYNLITKSLFSSKKNKFTNLIIKIKRKIGFKVEEFYQSEKYFKDIENIIREEFTLKNPLKAETKKWEERIAQPPISVSIHIRRGDYVQNQSTNAYHGTCNMDYYKNAIKFIKNKINSDFEIFIFSDDINWARENLKFPYKMYFVSNPEIPDCEEMYLMSLCKHNIIANSSFSWWGAWLNKNNNKIVVAPKKWFNNPKANKEAKDIVPKEWFKI